MEYKSYKKYTYSKDDSQKDDFSLNKHSISPHQSIHFGDLPLPKNHNGELLIKKPLKEKYSNFDGSRSKSAQKYQRKVDLLVDEEEEENQKKKKKDSVNTLQKLKMKNYLKFQKARVFAELVGIQNNNSIANNNCILKQSNAEIDSTKNNNDSKHFLLNPDKVNEDLDLNSLTLVEKANSNESSPHYEFKGNIIPMNPQQDFNIKEDLYEGDDKLLNVVNEKESLPSFQIKDLNIDKSFIMQEEEEKNNELLLIGKESDSLRSDEKDKSKKNEIDDSIVILPQMPRSSIPQNHLYFSPSQHSNNHDDNSQNGIYLKRKFSVEKRKIGFSTLSMRRDLFLFHNQEEKEVKSASPIMLSSMFDKNMDNAHERSERPSNKKVMSELENIEKHIILKRTVENFIILFNDNPEHGIEYLIDNHMIKDTEDDIAKVLLNTEGLSKITLGKYFGEPAAKNQRLFQAFCNQLNFQNMDLEEALRMMLSQFILPGESQQIERIISIFSEKYMKDNPTAFEKVDFPFILSYSFLMLNTDAHSSKIQNKNRMKKHEFVNNNMKCCPGVSSEYLENIYDRILEHEISTKIDYIETVYNKTKDVELLKIELEKGHNFLKYGRKGKPKKRFVFMDSAQERIYWKNLEENPNQARFITFSEIVDIYAGINATNVMKKNKVPMELNHLCFSLITKKRTLDLKASDPQIRYYWVQFLKTQLIQSRNSILIENDKQKRKKIEDDKEKISEIWKVDILPNWDIHWDYKARKPKNLEIYRRKKKQEKETKEPKKENGSNFSRFSKFFGCFISSKRSKTENFATYIDEDADTDEEIQSICRNKSLLLVILWKKGIPPWIRKTLWPIVIGNRLEISLSLYKILLRQVYNFSEDSKRYDKNIIHSLKLMEKDIPNTINSVHDFKIFQEEKMKKSLSNMLQAFIFYRPDVGFVKGMSHLAAVLLLFLAEYDAFCCLINLTHSHHFLSFLRGDMREIQWRVKFFDKYFERELPHLYEHFKAIDLSTEIFLFSWFLTLFSGCFNSEIVSRIWDCFLLDGEIYGFKSSLGILKYYELELRISTFDEAINILKDLPKDTSEERLFKIIEEIRIPYKEYANYLENQKMAEINTQIHQALLFVN